METRQPVVLWENREARGVVAEELHPPEVMDGDD